MGRSREDFAEILIDNPATFSGRVSNTGIVSGNIGILVFHGGTDGIDIFNSGTITGTGGTAIQLAGSDTLTLAPTSVINGNVLGGSNNILQLGANGFGTFDVSTIGAGAKYQGFGLLNKIDSSIWALTGSSTFTGPVNVSGGTLSVSGSLASVSLTTVNTGGTLSGSGTVGNTTINGGVLAPGNSIGTLAVQGNLVFTTAASYMIEASAVAADRTIVSGTATLAGTVQLSSPTKSYAFNSPYTILTTAGLAGTQFSALTTPTGIDGSLIYSGNSVLLTLTSAIAQAAGLNTNQRQIGAAFDAAFNTAGTSGPAGAIFTGNIAQNLTQASGETATGSQQATFNAMSQFVTMLLDPFIGERGSAPGLGATAYADEGHVSAYSSTGRRRSGTERDAYGMISKAALRDPVLDPRWSTWVAGFGGSQTTDGNATLGSNNTTSRIFGMATGADYAFSPHTIAGFALAGGGTSFSVANGGSGRSDLFQAGAFVRHAAGAAYVAGALAYGWQDITTDRTVTIAGVDRLRAQFNANAWSGRIEGGYRLVAPWTNVGLTPYAAAQFTTFELPTYAENVVSGANTFALGYASKSVTAARSELGLRADKSYLFESFILTLRGRAAWAHDYNNDRNVGATFQTLPGASFVVNGAAQASDSALTTASVELKWLNGWSAAATFEGEFSGVTRSYAGKGVVRYAW